MTMTTPAALAGATTTGTGTAVLTDVDLTTRDEARRLPAFVALAGYSGHGCYAEILDGMSVPEALTDAGLDFTVAKHDGLSVRTLDGDGYIAGLGNMRGTVAHFPDDREPKLLGIVGAGYEVVQPTEAAEFGQRVLDEAGATVVAVGAYGVPTGSRMYMALKLPNGLTIGGEDPYDLYLAVGNSWNRSTGLWGVIAPIRIDCTNQAAATFGKLSNRISLRHTAGVTSEVAEARRMLKLANEFTERFAAMAADLLATPMSGRDVDEFVDAIRPTPRTIKTERGEQNWADQRNAIKYVIRAGENNTVGRGTRYAAYQGLAEWTDWLSNARSPLSRAVRALDGGQHEDLKVRAAEMLTADL